MNSWFKLSHKGLSCHRKGRVVTRVNVSQGSSCHIKGRIVTRVELSHRSSCHKAQVVTRVELSLGRVVTRLKLSRESSCLIGRVVTRLKLSRESSCLIGRVVTRLKLSQGSSCHKGRVVTRVELSLWPGWFYAKLSVWARLPNQLALSDRTLSTGQSAFPIGSWPKDLSSRQGVSQDLEIGWPNLMKISKQGVQIFHLKYFYM